jgi:hypothetical protein
VAAYLHLGDHEGPTVRIHDEIVDYCRRSRRAIERNAGAREESREIHSGHWRRRFATEVRSLAHVAKSFGVPLIASGD